LCRNHFNFYLLIVSSKKAYIDDVIRTCETERSQDFRNTYNGTDWWVNYVRIKRRFINNCKNYNPNYSGQGEQQELRVQKRIVKHARQENEFSFSITRKHIFPI
jgi:hypothetical protein